MMYRETDRKPPMSPQLALRIAILGGIALVLFAIVFFRLWYLQVLSGDQYLQQARDNRVRELTVQAPRGDVLDRDGNVIVEALAKLPYANMTVKVDVDVPKRNVLVEQPEAFPGVSVERRYLRRYPQKTLAAQLVGSIGEIDDQELKMKRFKG